MAFDREDTDDWYQKSLLPVLKARQWNVRRIDRIEHNENIDAKILDELLVADLVIADLTYARPSVYFEAGYAQRVVPVVYTCRNDHFPPFKSDHDDVLRVHFDLQMRNIVRWGGAYSRTFPERIGKRIDYVARPILLSREKASRQQEEERKFQTLALTKKLDECLSAAQAAAKGSGLELGRYADAFSLLPTPRGLVARRVERKQLYGVQIVVAESFSKSARSDLFRLLTRPQLDFQMSRPRQLSYIWDALVLVSLNTLSLQQLTSSYQQFEVVDAQDKILQINSRLAVPTKRVAVDHVVPELYGNGPAYVGLTIRGHKEVRLVRNARQRTSWSSYEEVQMDFQDVGRTLSIIAIDKPRTIADLSERLTRALGATLKPRASSPSLEEPPS